MKIETDFLVIGSGIAGLTFALHTSKFGKVIVVTKKEKSNSNTNHAQGGVACVFDKDDSFTLHKEDTLTTGRGLSNEMVVETLVESGPERLQELIKWGANFTISTSSTAYKSLHLGREGGHSKNRIVHAKDMTGREIETTLLDKVKKCKDITIYENNTLVELITNYHIAKKNSEKNSEKNEIKRCYGAYVFDSKQRKVITILSKITMLATGGAGEVYAHTTNPKIATGDGLAAAYRSGAVIENMEFIQFHPTTLFHPDANSFLISEALRGHGAVLTDRDGNEFMEKYHKLKSLAPRDIVARAIDKEMKKNG